jgi:hypothetical protein
MHIGEEAIKKTRERHYKKKKHITKKEKNIKRWGGEPYTRRRPPLALFFSSIFVLGL